MYKAYSLTKKKAAAAAGAVGGGCGGGVCGGRRALSTARKMVLEILTKLLEIFRKSQNTYKFWKRLPLPGIYRMVPRK